MVRADLVQEIVARRERGESTRQIARELAVDRKTVRRWLRIGGWQPRQGGERRRAIDPYIEFVDQRGPEVGWNGVVLHRELMALGFSGSYQQVQRLLKPRRDRRRRQEAATVRSRLSRANRAGRLRPAPGLDRRASGDGPPVPVYAGLFAAFVYPRVSQRAAGHAARRPRARVSPLWRRDAQLFV